MDAAIGMFPVLATVMLAEETSISVVTVVELGESDDASAADEKAPLVSPMLVPVEGIGMAEEREEVCDVWVTGEGRLIDEMAPEEMGVAVAEAWLLWLLLFADDEVAVATSVAVVCRFERPTPSPTARAMTTTTRAMAKRASGRRYHFGLRSSGGSSYAPDVGRAAYFSSLAPYVPPLNCVVPTPTRPPPDSPCVAAPAAPASPS